MARKMDPSNSKSDQYVTLDGVKLHYVVAGPEEGPIVLLLHGFPEFWYGWRHQIPVLGNAGYLVIAPDQRGYNCNFRPYTRKEDSSGTNITDLGNAKGLTRAIRKSIPLFSI